MFTRRDLSDDLEAIREENVPGAFVFDTSDFETLPQAQAEELGIIIDAFDPITYTDEWLPSEPPAQLREYVGNGFTIGMPGDGGVTWTTQTDPPSVFVKSRMEGSPESFVDFLIAEAFVQAGLGLPEHFIGFFKEQYRDLTSVTPLSPVETYQLATALYEAYLGLYTRPVFESWDNTHPRLYDAWADAGEQLKPRLSGLAREVATDETRFAAAAEIGCSALKHGLDLPIPFGALDTAAYREAGPEYAVVWSRKTFEKLHE
jgi:hypothetical protein